MHTHLDKFEFRSDPTTEKELAPLECLKNQCLHFFLVVFNSNLLKPSGNEDIHNILDE